MESSRDQNTRVMLGAASLLLAIVVWLALTSAPAGATAVCEDEPLAGSCGLAYPSGTTFVAKSTNSTIKSSLGTIACTSETLEGKLSEEPTAEGEPLKASVSARTLSGCKSSVGGTCTTASAVKLPYAATFKWTSGANGTLTLSSGGSGEPGVSMQCGPLNCTFSASAQLTVTGKSSAATAQAKEVALNRAGGSCPASATWNATFIFEQPGGGRVQIAKARLPTVFCTENEARCGAGAGLVYPVGGEFEAALKKPATFDLDWLEPLGSTEINGSCEASVVIVKTIQNAAPLIANTQLGSPAFGKCTQCEPTFQNKPYAMNVEAMPPALVNGNGTARLRSAGNGPVLIELACTLGGGGGLQVKCNYEARSPAEQIEGTMTGGNPATIKFSDALESVAGSEIGCSSEMDWEAEYEITSPSPVNIFVTRK
ncbi:MAG TPA: hypothetical protein VLL27_10750 [Solirubrobacterales bacterium]|nr:hypothetical protein [Solirubrobacterales bacterium]